MPGLSYPGGFYPGGEGLRLVPVTPPPEPEPPAPTPTPGEGAAPAPAFGSLFAEEMFRALEPMAGQDALNGNALAALCEAAGSMYLQVEEAVRAREGFDAQTQTWDIDRTPAFLIPFVGQAAGVKVTPGTSATAQRAQVREGRQWKRGKLDQIAADLRTTLTGTQRIRFVERVGTPWQLEAITLPGETPHIAQTEAVGRASKPGGIIMIFLQSSLPIVDEGTRTIDAASGNIDTATIAGVT